jgi:phosphatidylglycerophosphatase C
MDALALFDFDGTMTRRDSLVEFLLYAFGPARVAWEGIRLSPVLVAYALGRMRNDVTKEAVTRAFLGGMAASRVLDLGRGFGRHRIPAILKASALARLRWHRRRGDRVLVVSANFEEILAPWALGEGAEIVATRLEARGGRLTGAFATPNCHGPEKVRRLRSLLEPHRYTEIYAYGDSTGDREMLALATLPHYRFFD